MPTAPESGPEHADPVRALDELVTRLDADPSPSGEGAFFAPFQGLARELIEYTLTVPSSLVAEQIAFSVYATEYVETSAWGLYFGPMVSQVDTAGNQWDSPSLSEVTPEVLSRWAERARDCRHPVMRARYADLLWELPKKLEGVRPDAMMARVAIDAYVEAIESERCEHQMAAIAKGRRALSLALSVSDKARVERVRDVLLALDDGGAPDEDEGSWGFCFDLFVESPNHRVPITVAHVESLVQGLEVRLSRMLAAAPSIYHPTGAEAATVRLADYYRRVGRTSDVVRVLEAYGEIIRRMRDQAAPTIFAHSLERLYDLFQSFGLRAQADSLNDLLREASQGSLADMKTISVEVPIETERIERYFAALLSGLAPEVIARIALGFTPERERLATELRELASHSPLMYLIPHEIKDENGLTIARIGPLDADPEGHLARHIAQHLGISTTWLREAFKRAIESGAINAALLADFVFLSPLYPAKRRPIIEAALKAYAAGEPLSAIHILVPQVEAAVRELAMVLHRPIYAPRDGGGVHLRTLNELLRDAGVAETLGLDIASYLQILLTDQRGWNLRNDLCHGLTPSSSMSMAVADRVLHAILVLALFRAKDQPAQHADARAVE